MTLCLAQSLIDHQGKFNAQDQAEKYVNWIKRGYLSSKAGSAFDVGNGKVKMPIACSPASSVQKRSFGF